MTISIAPYELKEIRRQVEALDDTFRRGDRILVDLILPEPRSRETLDYADLLRFSLEQMNCYARINPVLFFTCDEHPGKPWEVLKEQLLGLPCIRVYPR
jgi:hypothetical protein